MKSKFTKCNRKGTKNQETIKASSFNLSRNLLFNLTYPSLRKIHPDEISGNIGLIAFAQSSSSSFLFWIFQMQPDKLRLNKKTMVFIL